MGWWRRRRAANPAESGNGVHGNGAAPRILFISRAYPPDIGGIQTHNHDLAQALSHSADVHVISNSRGRRALWWFIPLASIETLMLAPRYDVIMLGDGVLSFLGWLVKRLRPRAVVVCVVHGLDLTWTLRVYQSLWVHRFLPALDRFIAVSEETRRVALDMGLPPDDVLVIPNGVVAGERRARDPEAIAALLGRPTEGRRLVLSLGRLVRRKGFAWFAESVVPLLPPDVLYIVAGEGPEHDHIAEAAEKAGVGDRVVLLGRVGDDAREKLFAGCDVFVQPNVVAPGDMEGFGIVVLEAGAAGLPVVASALEGLKDAVHDGVNGVLVPSEDAVGFGDAIGGLLADAERRAWLGDSAARHVRETYAWHTIAGRYLDVIADCMGRGGRPRVGVIGPILPFRGGIAQHTTMMHRALGRLADVKTLSFSRQYPGLLFPGESDRDPSFAGYREPGVEYGLDSLGPLSWRRTLRELDRWRPGLVVIPWWTVFWAPCFAFLGRGLRKRRIRVVFLCHNVVEHEAARWKRFLTRSVLRLGSAFIVQSREDEANLRELLPNASILFRPHPVYSQFPDAERTLPRVAATELLFFGFIRPYKGLDTLLDAMALLKDQDVHLTIAGEFWRGREETEARIQALGLERAVEVVPRYLTDREAAEYFERADVVVLPYNSATGSGVVGLAYRYGKPVVVTRVGGLPDVVDEGRTGLVVPPGSPAELAAALAQAATMHGPLTSDAIHTLVAGLGWDAYAEAILGLAGQSQPSAEYMSA